MSRNGITIVLFNLVIVDSILLVSYSVDCLIKVKFIRLIIVLHLILSCMRDVAFLC